MHNDTPPQMPRRLRGTAGKVSFCSKDDKSKELWIIPSFLLYDSGNVPLREPMGCSPPQVGRGPLVGRTGFGWRGVEAGIGHDLKVHLQPVRLVDPWAQRLRLSSPDTARARRCGPYHRMNEAHDAIRKWMAENRRESVGLSWEIYGDPTPAPEDSLTTVVYLLRYGSLETLTCGNEADVPIAGHPAVCPAALCSTTCPATGGE
jgi:hypothetical protein